MNDNIVLNKNGNKITGNIKDKNGNIISQLKTLLDKNSKPMWEKIINDGSLLVDFKSFFSKEGLKEKEISILNFQYFKSAFDKTFDPSGNIVKERIIERSKNDDIKGINIFKRKFDENNLMIKENKFKETGSGEKLIYTIKKEYNSCKLPVKEDFYNAKGELENSEYNVYDKRGRLRVSGYHEYGKYPESGYVVYDKNGIIRKKAILDEIEDSITEEYYDKNSLYIKKIIKNEEGLIFHKYDFIYDTDKKNRIKTIKRDGNNNIELTIDYFKDKDNKAIKVYKGPDGKLIGKEFIREDEKGYKHHFTNSEGKRCNFIEILIAVHDDMYV